MLDERDAGTTSLRRATGLVDVPSAAIQVPMLYSTVWGGQREGLGAALTLSYGNRTDVGGIGIGATGGGENDGKNASILTFPQLQHDILLAASLQRRVYVYSLEGFHDYLAGLVKLVGEGWEVSAAGGAPVVPEVSRIEARVARGVLGKVLRALG